MILWAIFPRGDRVGMDESRAVAWFIYRDAAREYCQEVYPEYGEVLPVTAEEVLLDAEEQ